MGAWTDSSLRIGMQNYSQFFRGKFEKIWGIHFIHNSWIPKTYGISWMEFIGTGCQMFYWNRFLSPLNSLAARSRIAWNFPNNSHYYVFFYPIFPTKFLFEKHWAQGRSGSAIIKRLFFLRTNPANGKVQTHKKVRKSQKGSWTMVKSS